MKDGFLRVACATPKIKVADCASNAKAIISQAKEASENGASLIVFPELCITGYTCSDLFLQRSLGSPGRCVVSNSRTGYPAFNSSTCSNE